MFFLRIEDVEEPRIMEVPDFRNHQRLVGMMRGWLHMQCLYDDLSRFKRLLEVDGELTGWRPRC